MAKNANKILKEIAVKMGGNVGEKDNDTNEFLTSIATSMGAKLDKKHNTNELLEIIADNIGEGGSGSGSGGGSIILPYGQTNPDLYFFKLFTDTSDITIDFTKFVDWYDRLGCKNAGGISYIEEWNSNASYPTEYDLLYFNYNIRNENYQYSSQYPGKLTMIIYDNHIDLSLYNNGDTIEIHIVSDAAGKSVMECLREVGTVTVNFAESYQIDYTDYKPTPCIVCSTVGFIKYDNCSSLSSDLGFNNDIELINTIDWIKINVQY